MAEVHPLDLTHNQALVLGALADAKAPLSAYSLLDLLRDKGLRTPPQIYRALEKLVELGLAHRLESMNAFVACAHQHDHEGCGATAFAICDRCGSVEEFCDSRISDQLTAWAAAKAFQSYRTTIELRGICAKCAS